MEDLFGEMIEQGVLKNNSSKLLALEFSALLFLLMNISDASYANLLRALMDSFIKRNAAEKPQNPNWY